MSIVIIINNYLHDVATAVLVASAALAWALDRAAAHDEGGRSGELLSAAYPRLVLVAKVALVWIILGGIPRTIFFTRFEWDPAVVRGIVPALVIKHILMVAGVFAGSVMWLRIGARVRGEVTS